MSHQVLAGHRLVVMAPDIPWPPNRGGRADVWRRMQALRLQGAAIFLVYLYEPSEGSMPTKQDFEYVSRNVEGFARFPMRRGLFLTLVRLFRSFSLPWHAATRVPLKSERQRLFSELTSFAPTMVWLEGPWFGELAKEVSDDIGIPLVYRSHNVEFRYLQGQAKAASRLRDRLAWRVACVGLERYELALMRRAQTVFDISIDDMSYWRTRGIEGARWLPPLPEMALVDSDISQVAGDIVFSGNLRTPNNLLGLQWLTDKVMPLVWQQAPEARLRVVGSAPSSELRERIAALPNVDASYDVTSVRPFIFGARVLANPVFVGSGVQLKTLDMLSTDVPIVTRSQGLRGLPPDLSAILHIADEPAQFAAALLISRAGPDPWIDQRQIVRKQFSVNGIARTVAEGVTSLNRSQKIAYS